MLSEQAITNVGAEPSIELLRRASRGDDDARNRLVARYLKPLRKWARGRLPGWVRDLPDTERRVHDVIADVLRNVGHARPNGPEALHAYLRDEVMNRLRGQWGSDVGQPSPVALGTDIASQFTSSLEAAMGKETLERYEAALADLDADDREVIIARVEWGMDDDELASALAQPTAQAARLAVRTATFKLADALRRGSRMTPPS